MSAPSQVPVRVAIACGGTGGHLFPGVAVAEHLLQRGCGVTLLVSPKEVDQEAVKALTGMEIVTLPGIGLTGRRRLAFLAASLRAYFAAKRLFQESPHQLVLGMGGFTSGPPILAARRRGARTFLHESNAIPGRATRLLSWRIDGAFVGFAQAAARLHTRSTTVTGTPVRAQFQEREPAVCRRALGLDPGKPVILVVGGSQGASGINALVINSLPLLAKVASDWQWFHLTGSKELDRCRQAYAKAGIRAVVHPFFNSMDLAMGAATIAVSRAGASSLAELAATRLPSVLVPYPVAVDNHQFYNARAFEQTGAARLMEQGTASPGRFSEYLTTIVKDEPSRARMRHALAQWHFPQAAEQMAEVMLKSVGAFQGESRELKPSSRNSEEGPSPAMACHPDSFEPTPLIPIYQATRTT